MTHTFKVNVPKFRITLTGIARVCCTNPEQILNTKGIIKLHHLVWEAETYFSKYAHDKLPDNFYHYYADSYSYGRILKDPFWPTNLYWVIETGKKLIREYYHENQQLTA